MRIGWSSTQGRERRSNNDAAAVGRKDHYQLAILVDAAEKANGQALARHWSRAVITAALAEEQLDPETVIRIMRAEQQELRREFLHAIASYCCALVDLQLHLLHVIHVGDCLAGIQRGETIDWLTGPHNFKEQALWAGFSGVPQEARHLLTRSLNARRFCTPDTLTIPLPQDGSLLLCSDGFWYEHLQEGAALASVLDDASVLRVEHGEPGITQQTDCDNFAALSA